MGRCKPLRSLNSLLSYAPQLSGANLISLFTLLLTFPQLLSNHHGEWQHLLDRCFGSPHSHLEARNRWWLWHFLFTDMAGDIFISLSYLFSAHSDFPSWTIQPTFSFLMLARISSDPCPCSHLHSYSSHVSNHHYPHCHCSFHSFNKYLQSKYSAPSSVLGAVNITMNKPDKNPALKNPGDCRVLSNCGARKWKWKSLSHVQLFVTPWTIQSMEFSRPEYWSG